MLEGVARELIARQQHLNELDVVVGDGDTGSTLAKAAELLLQRVNAGMPDVSTPPQLLFFLGDLLGDFAGG